jgi:hypothetical protein
VNKNKRCKTCKEPYEVHIHYILDEWDTIGSAPDSIKAAQEALDKIECNRFQPMDNLELLEWEEEKRRRETPTRDSLR